MARLHGAEVLATLRDMPGDYDVALIADYGENYEATPRSSAVVLT